MDKTEVVKKVHALMNDKGNYTARLQAEQIVENYVEQCIEAGQHETIVIKLPTLKDMEEEIVEVLDSKLDTIKSGDSCVIGNRFCTAIAIYHLFETKLKTKKIWKELDDFKVDDPRQ